MDGLIDREKTAERLLAASAKHSFDPDTELDWEAPFEEGTYFWPPELVSLYDTPLWKRLSPEQRIELSRHETASLCSIGVWFEMILMQLLLRHTYDLDPTSGHVRYALTEIADECRHSKMFARVVTKMDTPAYRPTRLDLQLGRAMKTISTTPGAFTGTLLAEEILDWMQRLTFPDERVQPLVRGITRIHVVEEARHIRYAREELRRQMATAPRWEIEFTRLSSAQAARVVARSLISPQAYASVGLDPEHAAEVARRSPHRREIMRQSAKRLMDFLDEVGLLRGPSRRLWRASGLLA
ncbi:P-aminobenzoate N-oxygenase AurF [Streptomyces sp. DvalAA-14]|uniref:AurF N-oxygenase family protein n=1 Tax=unclassified Streptomyces TaxID=2593676 RepID=UPI00081B07A8|nr:MULTISPECIES: diiron oxygenase [unclassified Streptomyces]MYS24557.1 diiron oxygenase [Streptomyces sp. SID4948]SCE47182.1 P-aminobenzoate N-oxygenase AurF [Streptomyces sp. DvalAA-14]